MTEGELLAKITAEAGKRGLMWHHCADSRRCQGAAGFPDLIIIGRHVLFAELKSQTGGLSADQFAAAAALHYGGAELRIWRTEHWPREIMRQLEQLAF